MLTIYLQGMIFGTALILPLGPQNVFVMNQGIQRQYHLMTASLCTLSDVLLIFAGIFGGSALLIKSPFFLKSCDLGRCFFSAEVWMGKFSLCATGQKYNHSGCVNAAESLANNFHLDCGDLAQSSRLDRYICGARQCWGTSSWPDADLVCTRCHQCLTVVVFQPGAAGLLAFTLVENAPHSACDQFFGGTGNVVDCYQTGTGFVLIKELTSATVVIPWRVLRHQFALVALWRNNLLTESLNAPVLI